MNPIESIKKLWKWRWLLRSLPSSIYFNFHYLPLAQALRLPILLYKPRLLKMRGTVRIEGDVRFGQILLGQNLVSLYPNDGIVFENHGGTLTFSGRCTLGNGTRLSIGPEGHLSFGHNVCASAALRLACYKQIRLQDRVRLGWEVTMLDTDFHKLTLREGGYTQPTRPVEIGENSWLGYGCTVLKGTCLPPYTTVSAKTVLGGKYDVPTHCVIGTEQTVKVRREGAFRNLEDDRL